MTDKEALSAEYLPRVNAELRRIGFTDEDFAYLGSGGELTRDALEAQLADLRSIPSHIGAIAYFARLGVDLAALKRDSTSASPDTSRPGHDEAAHGRGRGSNRRR